MISIRGITVCVDYSDLLSVTLPRNRHHFSDYMVVTSHTDKATFDIVYENNCRVYATDSFYGDGASFNKWKALEEALDIYGRHGLMCIMDADVIWPKRIGHVEYQKGVLYTPKRRMLNPIPSEIPHESTWGKLPLHPQQREYAGYTQIFHATDPHLPKPPWHEIDWVHAGGADSFFQMRWPDNCKRRPNFEVLHLGPSGVNWCGRVTEYRDGRQPSKSEEYRRQLREYKRNRRNWRTKTGDPYAGEKIRPPNSGEEEP